VPQVPGDFLARTIERTFVTARIIGTSLSAAQKQPLGTFIATLSKVKQHLLKTPLPLMLHTLGLCSTIN
jgi:hypothetical protein